MYLEYDFIGNWHEYMVTIIDMQDKSIGKLCIENEKPTDARYMFHVNYPVEYFNPYPFIINQVLPINQKGIRIIFADINYMEKYEIVEVTGQNQFGYSKEYTENIYATVGARAINKTGKKVKTEKYKIAQTIAKYVEKYNVTFEFPTIWDSSKQVYISNRSYFPLLFNQDNEVVSYYGYSEETGYELLLPICRDKEKLVEELITFILPKMLPDIFPESNEFCWISENEFKPNRILELERRKSKLKKEYEMSLLEIEAEEKKEYENYQFLNDLLVQTGDKLVRAVCKYLSWIGYSHVQERDGDEEILREDIQVIEKNDLFIIAVKGLEKTSTDSECSQITKHRQRREKENRGKNIIPIYIVNHQRHIKPQLRKKRHLVSFKLNMPKMIKWD